MTDAIYTRENPGEFGEKAEKHIPAVSVAGATVTVRVGSEAHPMEEEHFIQWVALYRAGQEVVRQDLSPSDAPEATFADVRNSGDLKARAGCNLHGVWESD